MLPCFNTCKFFAILTFAQNTQLDSKLNKRKQKNARFKEFFRPDLIFSMNQNASPHQPPLVIGRAPRRSPLLAGRAPPRLAGTPPWPSASDSIGRKREKREEEEGFLPTDMWVLYIKALFVFLIIRLFQLVFSDETVFFSHNKSAEIMFRLVFFSEANGT